MEESLLGVPTRLIRPVRHGNAFEETIERLLQNIKLGLFGVGDKLPAERELSELLGVSRATLRDALAELQKAGYVEVRRGRTGGTYVSARRLGELRGSAGLDPAEVNDVLTFRAVLVAAAASVDAQCMLSPRQRRLLLDSLADVAGARAAGCRRSACRTAVGARGRWARSRAPPARRGGAPSSRCRCRSSGGGPAGSVSPRPWTPSSRPSDPAAVDAQRLAGHVGRALAREEQHGTDHLADDARPSQRRVRVDPGALVPVLEEAVHARREPPG